MERVSNILQRPHLQSFQSPKSGWTQSSEKVGGNEKNSNQQQLWKIQIFCPELSVFLVIVLVQTVRNSPCSSCEWAIERSCQEGAGRNFQEEIYQSFQEVFAGHIFILSMLSIFLLILSLVCLFLVVVWNYESTSRPWANDAKMLMMIAKIWRIV